MTENKKHKAMMETAYIWAALSYCKRNQVGAVLAKDGRIVAIGYNGTLRGNPNDCEEEKEGNLVTLANVVHAEQNVLAFAARHGIPTEGCDLYVTLSPCDQCAKLIVQSGIKRVIYDKEYRDITGISILKVNDIFVMPYSLLGPY